MLVSSRFDYGVLDVDEPSEKNPFVCRGSVLVAGAGKCSLWICFNTVRIRSRRVYVHDYAQESKIQDAQNKVLERQNRYVEQIGDLGMDLHLLYSETLEI